MSPKCPIRFNVSLLKWINLAKLPGWCEYLCALCLSDGARLPFFFPSSMEMCWYFQLRGKCIQITYFTAAGELVDFYDTRLPPGAICKSDAAGSIQIKIALFFPGGEIHFFTQSVINCTHTHAQWVQYSATYPLCADSSTRDLNPPPSGLLIDGGRTESWENVWSFSAARFNSLSAFLKTWQFKDEEVFKRCGDAAPRCVDHFICLMSVSHTASHVAARCDEPRWGGWLCAILSQAAVD